MRDLQVILQGVKDKSLPRLIICATLSYSRDLFGKKPFLAAHVNVFAWIQQTRREQLRQFSVQLNL